MKKITVASFKGGTAKTSSVLHIAAALALFNKKKCLVVDSDPQANLSTGLGFSPDDLDALPAVLQDEKSIQEVIKKTNIPGLDIITGNSYLDQIESTVPLVSDAYSHERLRKALALVDQDYDFCFIDIPPSLGWLCRSAFYAADYSFISTTPEPYSVLAMERLAKYHETINRNHSLRVLGVLLSMWDERGAINDALIEEIEAYFPGKIFDTKVRRDKSVSTAVLSGNPVFSVKKGSRAGEDYKALAKEIVKRISKLKDVELEAVAGV